MTADSQLPDHGWLREPALLFHPSRHDDISSHPLRGLLQYGPYSRSLLNTVFDPIRVAYIAPFGRGQQIEKLVAELEQHHKPRERREYLQDFPGMSRVFGTRVVLSANSCRVEMSETTDYELSSSRTPQMVLAERLTAAINALTGKRHEFDVLLIFLPETWSAAFFGDNDDDFDLHDYLKATTAVANIPCQIVRDRKTGAMSYFCRCSVMWRLSIALYAKAGGIPWKLAGIPDDTAFIGLGYTVRSRGDRSSRFVSCCSQVFDADGAGLEFLVYSTNDAVYEGENPFLSRHDMFRIMSRSLELYQRRHPGRNPTHVVVHKSTEFKREEIDGCFDAFPHVASLDLVQVQQELPWLGIQNELVPGQPKGEVGRYPCLRGSYLPLGGREVLLWTQGDAPGAQAGKHFFKEGKGIPAPLLLRRFAGHGGWEETCHSVLGLTKMDWNSDSLYSRMPATIEHAKTLASVVKKVGPLASGVFQYRFFM